MSSNREQTTHVDQQNSSFILSRDPNKAMQEMMDQIDHLRGIYLDETNALENADTNTFFSLQDKKLEAAKHYESGIQQIIGRSDEMKTASPHLKKKLKDMQVEFSDLAQQNMQALERMKRCTERLGQTLRHAAKETARKKRSFSYGETGVINSANRKSLSMGVSETA